MEVWWISCVVLGESGRVYELGGWHEQSSGTGGQSRSGVLFGSRGRLYLMTGTRGEWSAIVVCYSLEC